MNVSWPRIWKSVYRREPISGFIITVGAVDAAIGGMGGRGSLLAFGLMVASAALVWRWWVIQRTRLEEPERVAQHYLPPTASRPQLPTLMASKKHPPRP
ncbi:MAG: hypothetical protein N3E45_06710 [Oscillatoriaceae bacterium SKW80]|nr:hypothetical protein [Oscillatoriaceae bacterium SKYG93]MCX8120506.1 hypothetical protein [Oscillatoriaceae bacterium SKW80]MDW8452744.1 hypothetical protein [Oscillatoriaceae cyanobacterium SKYGB_i_bin93]HIK27186.1 hypothetical protein [Oscillatoriaceae cyanobacterium M7585_C2015_266]